ncbi:MAG: Tll0287-like domain-containing protein [Acidobacteriota bacterium]
MKRQRATASAVLLALLLAASLPASLPADEELLITCRGAAAALQRGLQAALSAAMREGGPEKAVTVCRDRAPEIAADISRSEGVQVRRTALRVRNPKNAPDAWERETLEAFAARMAEGEDPAALERWVLRPEDGKLVYRYMKAIPTGETCLSCHGPAVEEGLRRRIQEAYPEDAAVGFAKGDLRGAFTIRKVVGTAAPEPPPRPAEPNSWRKP